MITNAHIYYYYNLMMSYWYNNYFKIKALNKKTFT